MSDTARRVLLVYLIATVACCALIAMCNGCESAAKKKQRQQAEEQKRQQQTNVTLAVVESDAVGAQEAVDKTLTSLNLNPPDITEAKNQSRIAKGSLDKVVPGIRKGGTELTQTKTDYWAQRKRADAAETERDQPLNKQMNFYIGLLVIGVVGGIIAGLIGMKLSGVVGSKAGAIFTVGYDVAAGCGLGIGLCLLIEAVGPYKKYAGMGLIAYGGGLLVWYTWRRLRGAKKTKRAVELVATGEALLADPRVPDQVFYEAAAKTQSPDTTKFVREVKAKGGSSGSQVGG